MSSRWELDKGIESIKSAWRREHTARANLEKMLEQAEAENAKLRELCKDMWSYINAPVNQRNSLKERLAIYDDFADIMRELGVEASE